MASQNVTAVYDRVKTESSSTGTGTLTLSSASDQFRAFADVFSDTDTTYYTILSGDSSSWETGVGTVGNSGTELARTTVLSNSAGTTAKISLTGTSTVFCSLPAAESVHGLPHVAKMTQTSSQNVSDGALTPVEFDVVDWSTGIVASTSSDHFTIKRAGKYSISCQWSGSDESAMASISWMMPTLNGTALGDVCGMNEKESDSGDHYQTLSFHLDLDVDDVIRHCVYHNGGGGTDSNVGSARWRPRMSIVEVR